jgi:hypothetical protein
MNIWNVVASNVWRARKLRPTRRWRERTGVLPRSINAGLDAVQPTRLAGHRSNA